MRKATLARQRVAQSRGYHRPKVVSVTQISALGVPRPDEPEEVREVVREDLAVPRDLRPARFAKTDSLRLKFPNVSPIWETIESGSGNAKAA